MPYVRQNTELEILEYPPVNYKNIINFNKNIPAMLAEGYTDWTDQQIAQWYQDHKAPTPPLTTCTKYQLVQCLRTNYPELLEQLRTQYATNSDLAFYWNTVQDLDRNNSDFQAIVSQLGISQEIVDDIFDKIQKGQYNS